jgi:hypothetical protein
MHTVFAALGRVLGGLLERLRPRPETIQLIAIRGDTGLVGGEVVQAGATRSWHEAVAAGVDGVLLVMASLIVEHGTGPLDDEPDTTVELALFVDGARIGRAVESLRAGDDRSTAVTASIRVSQGVRQVRATFRPGAAAVRIGEVSVAALFVPEAQASIGSG